MQTIKKIFRGFTYCFRDINEYNWVYKIIALLGLILRVGLLPILIPEPFELLSRILVGQAGLPVWAFEIIIRIILLAVDALALSNIFYWVSYWTVGNMYESDSGIYWWGSLCYTIFYFIYMVMAWLLIEYFIGWVIGIVLGCYLVICIALYLISGLALKTFSDAWWLRLILHVVFFVMFCIGVISLKLYVF